MAPRRCSGSFDSVIHEDLLSSWRFTMSEERSDESNGAPGRDRTCDLELRSLPLFQLSYGGNTHILA